MKKIFYLASIAALAFSSCTKDETTGAVIDTVGGSKIVAAMEADDTRSELVESGSGYEIVWKSSDALSVFSNATGVQAMPNERFQLDNASDGVASGAFSSKRGTLNASKKYLALYPYSESYDGFQPTWNRKEYEGYANEVKGLLDYSAVNMTIPATQDYVPGSFDTNTIPAISSEFTVGENNTATVKMQPVVDYLMVDIVSTEPITEIKLEMYKGEIDNAHRVNIAGTGALEAYKVGDNTRYVLTSENLTEPTITLNTKQLAGDVSLAEANTYVFAIPGGLLGSWDLETEDEYLIPVVYVSDGTTTQYFVATNEVNYYMATPTTAVSRVYGKDARYTHYGDLVYYTHNRENTVFYMNKKNAAGERVAFEFNPYEEATIYDELDLIEYIVTYDENDGPNAYVAEDAVFDLSVSHLSKILSEVDKRQQPELYTAINGYIAGTSSFPVIEKYNHEFKGNGAAITNIEKPLAELTGLFGELEANAKISNLVLSNIVAATAKEADDEFNGNGVKKETYKGVVLASEVANQQISNITVSNLDADAVIGSGNLNNYNAIKVGEAGLNKKLNHIMQSVDMTGNLTYKAEAWAAVSTVNESVFNTIVPATNGDAGAPNTEHTIATLPAGAKYEKFVEEVDYESNTNVLSVLIDGISYWTGGELDSETTVYGYYKANKGTYNNYTAIRYAEELAGDYVAEAKLYLVRDLDMNYNNNATSWTTNTNAWAELYGAGHTVKGLTMLSKADDQKDRDEVLAPFSVKAIENVNFDGISINIVTTNTTYPLPRKISGLSNELDMVKNVNIKNIEVMGSSSNDVQKKEPHYPSKQVWLGWLSALATDIEVNNVTITGAKTNISGISGAVGCLFLENLTSWFNDFSINNVSVHSDAVNMTEFTVFDSSKIYNNKGTAVGNVSLIEASLDKTSVKFDNSGSPKFTYNIANGNDNAYINVLYNDKVVETLRDPDYEE